MFHTQLLFLDIGGPEMMLIMVAALLMFGGQKLPELARGLGKGIRDFKDAANGVKDDLQDSMTKLQEEHNNLTNSVNIVDSHSNPYAASLDPVTDSSVTVPHETILVDAHNQPLETPAHSNSVETTVPAAQVASVFGDNKPYVDNSANHPLITPAGMQSVPYSAHTEILTPVSESHHAEDNGSLKKD